MARKRVIEQLAIEDIEYGGKGVGRRDGKVIFVEQTLPGDVVDARLIKNKKDFAIGKPIKFHSLSDQRIAAFCQHFGTCGGCKWQNIDYSTQLAYKTQFVEQSFTRIGKLDFPAIQPIIGCEDTQFYRNKLEYTFSNKRWLTQEEIDSDTDFDSRNALGFHIPGQFDKVLDIETCYLQASPSNDIRLAVKAFADQHGLTFFDIREQTGFLRNLVIRTTSTGQVMVILVVTQDDKTLINPILDDLKDKFPDITSLNYVVNDGRNDVYIDKAIITYAGQPYIEEQLGHVKFQIGPASFFQTNSIQANNLYSVVAKMANLQGNEIVVDLYTGIGSIALFLAKDCQKTYGVELVEPSIIDARKNALLNGIENCDFSVGDVKDVLEAGFLSEKEKPDLLITDPPRAGMHPDVAKALSRSGIPRIIYVSCNPTTQARDLTILCENYQIEEVQPVDMFPQTYHIENVVSLTLKR